MWSQILEKKSKFCLEFILKKKLKVILNSFQKNFFLNVYLKQNLDFFYLRPNFQNSFVPRFVYVFCTFLHECTFVYIKKFTNFCPFWAIFAALRPSFSYFYNFFRGLEVCLENCDSIGNFGYLKKIKHFYSKRIL